MANPLILSDNRFNDGTPAATDTAAGYDVLNIRDLRTYTAWKAANATGTKYLTVDCGVAKSADALACIGHNLFTAGASVGIQYSSDNFAADINEALPNRFTYSEQFSNASWGKTRCSIVPDAAVAPDGMLTADKIVEDNTATNTHVMQKSVTATVNQTWSLSYYVKRSERYAFRLAIYDAAAASNQVNAVFDLAAGSVYSFTNAGNGANAAATISLCPNGFYRCTVSGIPNTSGATVGTQFAMLTSPSGNVVYSGDGVSGIYIWGAQLEAAAAASEYQRTGGTAQAYLPTSDKAFKSLFTSRSARYWRLKIVNASTAPKLSVCALGERLAFPMTPDTPFLPYRISIEADSANSKRGHLLGSVIRYKPIEISPRFSTLDRAWVLSTFKAFWLTHYSQLKPFFWIWDADTYPEDVFLVQADEKSVFETPVSVLAYVDSIDLKMRGVLEA